MKVYEISEATLNPNMTAKFDARKIRIIAGLLTKEIPESGKLFHALKGVEIILLVNESEIFANIIFSMFYDYNVCFDDIFIDINQDISMVHNFYRYLLD